MSDEKEVFTVPTGEDISEKDAGERIAGLMGLGGNDEETPDDETDAPESEAETPAEDSEEDAGDESEETEETEESAAEDEEDAESEEDTEETPETDLHEVKVDGKTHKVTLDEMKKSFSFQKHLTQKSQKVAEKEKFLDGEYAAVSGERAKYKELIGELEVALKSAGPQEPDWDMLMNENPIEFAVERQKWALRQQRLDGLRAEREHVDKLQQEHAIREAKRLAEENLAKLPELVPAWKDEKVMKADIKATIAYAKDDIGMTEAELSQIFDPRYVVILNKARLYDARQKAKPAIQKRVAQVVKTAKPGSAALAGRKAGNVSRLAQRASRTGDVDDVANLILSRGLIK